MYEYEHELPFEKDLVNLLVKEKGWVDDVFINPSEEDLIKNWVNIVFNNNRKPERLSDYPLTKGEIDQLMEQINNAATPLQKNELITNDISLCLKRFIPMAWAAISSSRMALKARP